MLHVFVKEIAYFIKFLNQSNLQHKRCTMTKKTILIFQLFLAIVAIYTLLDQTYHLLVPFFCLTGMFFVGREKVAFKKISEKVIHPIRKEAIAQARRAYFMCGQSILAHRIWAGKSLANLSCKRGSLCSNCLSSLEAGNKRICQYHG